MWPRASSTMSQPLKNSTVPLRKTSEIAEQKMEGKHAKVPDVETDEICPNCGKRWS